MASEPKVIWPNRDPLSCAGHCMRPPSTRHGQPHPTMPTTNDFVSGSTPTSLSSPSLASSRAAATTPFARLARSPSKQRPDPPADRAARPPIDDLRPAPRNPVAASPAEQPTKNERPQPRSSGHPERHLAADASPTPSAEISRDARIRRAKTTGTERRELSTRGSAQQEALTGFFIFNVFATSDRAVKAPPPGGLRPALTALP